MIQSTNYNNNTVLPEINITANITNPSSPILGNGNITTLVTGGGGGYIYQWDTAGTILNQFTGPNALNLAENTYCLNILDNNGCTADTCFAVEWNPCQVLDSLITPVACNGGQAMIEITLILLQVLDHLHGILFFKLNLNLVFIRLIHMHL